MHDQPDPLIRSVLLQAALAGPFLSPTVKACVLA